jgi:hypothetical protein
MEAARTSETSVDNYFTRQYIPEDNFELHTRRRENLKSHLYDYRTLHEKRPVKANREVVSSFLYVIIPIYIKRESTCIDDRSYKRRDCILQTYRSQNLHYLK